jgi:hypothetical protein
MPKIIKKYKKVFFKRKQSLPSSIPLVPANGYLLNFFVGQNGKKLTSALLLLLSTKRKKKFLGHQKITVFVPTRNGGPLFRNGTIFSGFVHHY